MTASVPGKNQSGGIRWHLAFVHVNHGQGLSGRDRSYPLLSGGPCPRHAPSERILQQPLRVRTLDGCRPGSLGLVGIRPTVEVRRLSGSGFDGLWDQTEHKVEVARGQRRPYHLAACVAVDAGPAVDSVLERQGCVVAEPLKRKLVGGAEVVEG
jgi:hypothetical protein